jgi:hypothetical protein
VNPQFLVVEDREGNHERREHRDQSNDRVTSLHIVFSLHDVLAPFKTTIGFEDEGLKQGRDAIIIY